MRLTRAVPLLLALLAGCGPDPRTAIIGDWRSTTDPVTVSFSADGLVSVRADGARPDVSTYRFVDRRHITFSEGVVAVAFHGDSLFLTRSTAPSRDGTQKLVRTSGELLGGGMRVFGGPNMGVPVPSKVPNLIASASLITPQVRAGSPLPVVVSVKNSGDTAAPPTTTSVCFGTRDSNCGSRIAMPTPALQPGAEFVDTVVYQTSGTMLQNPLQAERYSAQACPDKDGLIAARSASASVSGYGAGRIQCGDSPTYGIVPNLPLACRVQPIQTEQRVYGNQQFANCHIGSNTATVWGFDAIAGRTYEVTVSLNGEACMVVEIADDAGTNIAEDNLCSPRPTTLRFPVGAPARLYVLAWGAPAGYFLTLR